MIPPWPLHSSCCHTNITEPPPALFVLPRTSITGEQSRECRQKPSSASLLSSAISEKSPGSWVLSADSKEAHTGQELLQWAVTVLSIGDVRVILLEVSETKWDINWTQRSAEWGGNCSSSECSKERVQEHNKCRRAWHGRRNLHHLRLLDWAEPEPYCDPKCSWGIWEALHREEPKTYPRQEVPLLLKGAE